MALGVVRQQPGGFRGIGVGSTFYSPRGSGCEGAGLGDEAPETGAAVVG